MILRGSLARLEVGARRLVDRRSLRAEWPLGKRRLALRAELAGRHGSHKYTSPFVKAGWYKPYDHDVFPLGDRAEGNPFFGLGMLTAANVAVWLAWQETDDDDDRLSNLQFMMDHFTVSWQNVESGRGYTTVSSAFSHEGLAHLGGNMFALWLFGFKLYRTIGSFARFAALYLFAGAAGSLGHLAFTAAQIERARRQPDGRTPSQCDVPALGASGAVMGVSCASACLFPWDRILLPNRLLHALFLPLPWAVLLYIASDLYGVTTGQSQGIANAAHLAGCAAGFAAVCLAWYRNPARGGQPLPLFRIHRKPPVSHPPPESIFYKGY